MKNIFTFILILSFVTTAGVKQLEGYSDKAVFYQFTHIEPANQGDYHDGHNAGQNWLASQTISLLVNQECDVWLSNYVSTWYGELEALDGYAFQMGAGQYGAWQLNGDKEWIGTGEARTVTFTDGQGHENSTSAYFLGHFEGGEQIAMYLTALETDGGEMVDTRQYVYDAEHGTILASRLDGTKDLADNVRINLGMTTYPTGREYIAYGACDWEYIKGQPLPSVMFSALLALGSVALAGRRRI